MSNNFIIIVGATIAILVVVMILALARTYSKAEFEWKAKTKKHLSELYTHFDSRDTLTLKNVLIELDKLLDFVLKNRQIPGETMGERLKNSKDKFEWKFYQQIWEAHKARNELVHELGAKFTPNAIKKHINTLYQAIKHLL